MDNDEHQCAHESCQCAVSGNDIYCSEFCKRADETQRDGECHCAHADCVE